MTRKLENRPERERPEFPAVPFLCASCRSGVVLVLRIPPQETPVGESWAQEAGKVQWHWQARCNNPRVAGRWPETFDAPVVDCEGYEARSFGEDAEDARAESGPGGGPATGSA